MTYRFGTKAIHAGQKPEQVTGAIMTPIFQSSTYRKSLDEDTGFYYSRGDNPTRKALEDCLAELENGRFGLVFSSGMAAIDCVLRLLKSGDVVVAGVDLYGGTYRIFTQVYAAYGITFKFVDTSDLGSLTDAIDNQTKLVWIETPTNPTLQLADLNAIKNILASSEALYVVDNTFATPYLQNPLDFDADIVMHSVTKFIGGHSDVVMGALVTKDELIYQRLRFFYNTCGATPGPQDCFLVLRGIKTLHLRMRAHCENAGQVALFLKKHPRIEHVFYPGFSEHKGYLIARRQMSGFGAVVTVVLKGVGLEETLRIASRFKLFTLAESLGGVESMVNHSATMSHGSVPRKEREEVGVVDNMLRFSVGIEDVEDLIMDLEQGLS